MTENQFYEYLYQQEQRSKSMNEWQPIETAPKDGTEIDLWAGGFRFPDSKYYKDAWRYWGPDDYDSQEWVKIIHPVTHWMPLPKPPTE